jgi:hypothetical protein
MSVQQVDFILGTGLVEIMPELGDPDMPAYSAFVSLIERDGAIIRPVVRGDGRRVRIRAGSEPVALLSAISYLTARLGAPKDDAHPCSLATATLGRPIPLG